MEALNLGVRFKTVTCCKCFVSFAMSGDYYDARLDAHDTFYCPAGHPQHFTGKSEVEKLREEVEQQKKFKQWANDRADTNARWAEREKRRAQAYKGVASRTKKRIANGVCPCCNRSFGNLLSHMKTKHPNYRKVRVAK